MDERSYPTRVVELPLEYSQVIGLPSGLRRCAGPTVLELWFEGSGGPATCARLVAQLLQKAFGRGLMYMRTSVPLSGPGIEEVTFNGIAFQAVLDSSRIADLLAAGWNSELQPFIVIVGAPSTGSSGTPTGGLGALCEAQFAVACGADGCVAQFLPMTQRLEALRSIVP